MELLRQFHHDVRNAIVAGHESESDRSSPKNAEIETRYITDLPDRMIPRDILAP